MKLLSVVHITQTHSERAPEDEWLDILPHPVFSPNGDSFMLLAGIQETNTEHFTHIKHVTITQQRISVISHGRYEVSIPTHPRQPPTLSGLTLSSAYKSLLLLSFYLFFMFSRCFLFLHFCRSWNDFFHSKKKLFIDGFSFVSQLISRRTKMCFEKMKMRKISQIMSTTMYEYSRWINNSCRNHKLNKYTLTLTHTHTCEHEHRSNIKWQWSQTEGIR